MQNEDKLRACYDELSELLEDNADPPEPWESVKLVEEYRRYWRPDNVRVILLAESHVYTTDEERKFQLSPHKDLPNYPQDYARFVYCLADGENSLLANGHPEKNLGTLQLWKLFYSCENYVDDQGDFDPITHRGTPDEEQRIKHKINLLNSLRERGIWLIDTSIMAIDRKDLPNNMMPQVLQTSRSNLPNNMVSLLLKTSWNKYTGQIVKDANPDFVIMVGQEVAEALVGEITYKKEVLSHLNDLLTYEQIMDNWQRCYDLCQKYAPQK